MRSHPTTEASEHFKNYIAAIQQNLKTSKGKNSLDSLETSEEIRNAEKFYEDLFQKLLVVNGEKGKQAVTVVREELEEVQILMDRLKWLLEISGNIKKLQLKKT